MRILVVLMLFGAFVLPLKADPSDSCVRIPSHGGSGCIVATGEGWTLVMSCWHCFDGKARSKPIVVNMRHPSPGPHQKVGTQLLAIGSQAEDVALLRVNVGPVPFVAPVAPIGYRPDPDCWSCGFDEMKFPVHQRPARILQQGSATTTTDARPWHGRSGGSLIEKRSGYLVGVVSAYSGPSNRAEYHPGANGYYASLPAIHRLLARAGVMQGDVEQQQPLYQPQQRYQQQQSPFGPGGYPDGFCPIPGAPQFGGGQQRRH